MQAETVSDVDEEAIEVFHWRVHCFLELGLTLRQSRRLANGDAHWDRAGRLLEDGCPADLLVQILS